MSRPRLPELFVTPHAIERFRSRAPDATGLTDEQAIAVIKSQLEGTNDLPVYAEMKGGVLARTYRFRHDNNIYYAVVVPHDTNEDACTVVTVLDHTNRIHRIVQGRQRDRKRDPKRVSQEEGDTMLALDALGYGHDDISTIMRRGHTVVWQRLISGRGIKKHIRKWSNRELAKALELRRKGLSFRDIAKRLDRSPQSVKARLFQLNQEMKKHPERRFFWQVVAWCTNPTKVLQFIRDAGLMDRFREEVIDDNDVPAIPHIHIPPDPLGSNANTNCRSA